MRKFSSIRSSEQIILRQDIPNRTVIDSVNLYHLHDCFLMKKMIINNGHSCIRVQSVAFSTSLGLKSKYILLIGSKSYLPFFNICDRSLLFLSYYGGNFTGQALLWRLWFLLHFSNNQVQWYGVCKNILEILVE